jgi:hypothetical protein
MSKEGKAISGPAGPGAVGMVTLVASTSSHGGAASSGDDVGGSVMPSSAVHPARPFGQRFQLAHRVGRSPARPSGYHPACTLTQRFHLVVHYRVMSQGGPLPTVGHTTVPSEQGGGP